MLYRRCLYRYQKEDIGTATQLTQFNTATSNTGAELAWRNTWFLRQPMTPKHLAPQEVTMCQVVPILREVLWVAWKRGSSTGITAMHAKQGANRHFQSPQNTNKEVRLWSLVCIQSRNGFERLSKLLKIIGSSGSNAGALFPKADTVWPSNQGIHTQIHSLGRVSF